MVWWWQRLDGHTSSAKGHSHVMCRDAMQVAIGQVKAVTMWLTKLAQPEGLCTSLCLTCAKIWHDAQVTYCRISLLKVVAVFIFVPDAEVVHGLHMACSSARAFSQGRGWPLKGLHLCHEDHICNVQDGIQGSAPWPFLQAEGPGTRVKEDGCSSLLGLPCGSCDHMWRELIKHKAIEDDCPGFAHHLH